MPVDVSFNWQRCITSTFKGQEGSVYKWHMSFLASRSYDLHITFLNVPWTPRAYLKTSRVFLSPLAMRHSWVLLTKMYEVISKSFRTESMTKYTTTKINSRWEATQRVMGAKLATLTHKIAIQLHPVAESCNICSSHSGRPVPRNIIENSNNFS